MHDSHPSDSRSPPLAGTVTRADPGAGNLTAQPPLTSGFGAVMEHEHDIQYATTRYLDADRGMRSDVVDRLLRQQQSQVGANIALLEQRYEMLPEPARFRALHERLPRLSKARSATGSPNRVHPLGALITEHLKLLANIDELIAQRPDGQRGELILIEVARSHEEMAWELTTMRKDIDAVRDQVPMPVIAAVFLPEGRWENEGGALSVPVASAAAALRQEN